ncbi:hypothetical protein LEP1GSC103_3086 [Leptospira borgpetersenii serovar Javanica str. UI 09931]|uniref:Uncharacterized protein n=5 Tax=Leptospira borgpetersenii TaxID=174 RepID=M3GYX2_LEPBO|nr:hypothetical protein LBBP_01967 [Leptospira borgpetersenii serovar Ballum]EKP14254.1 hypothetical protein LEP1GSC128_2994 [Leptospira borgpetersenii str. 200801926]EKQ91779.1 hypothetical protein LEP1GSC101_3425 [Leptospira borgpetersenii str. UI 09149]EKR01939.1 hypothetical protein LEP1GSC121_3927 [Leptospira borgpetersenii serovar Castellonis str. 200801910]EMG00019.1 hypothetical protein LEP1GSC123_4314 [Leptospira borgpetersenii str. 200701203]EMK10332.1 hypothetical protein LEP1GSC066
MIALISFQILGQALNLSGNIYRFYRFQSVENQENSFQTRTHSLCIS